MEQVDYREALHALEAVTGSFLVPISDRLLLVVKDTPQKRREEEPYAAIIVPLPEPTSQQESDFADHSRAAVVRHSEGGLGQPEEHRGHARLRLQSAAGAPTVSRTCFIPGRKSCSKWTLWR